MAKDPHDDHPDHDRPDDEDHQHGATPPDPLRPQRGGSPSSGAVWFRGDFVAFLAERLAAGESLVVTAERRVGKTSVVLLLTEGSWPGLHVVSRDVEDISTPSELVARLCADVLPLLDRTHRAKRRVRALWDGLGGAEVGGVLQLPQLDPAGWKADLASLFDALAEDLGDEAIAIVWDEVPWMVEKVRDTAGWQEAVDLLDALRAVRQRHANIRFVFIGSIGFHHVLRDLRNGLSHASTLTDVATVELPPLAPPEAVQLAWALLRWIEDHRGATFAVPPARLASHIARRCEGIPWSVHATVDDLASRPGPLAEADVDAVIEAARFQPNGGWQLRHYVDRLEPYYGADAERAGRVLDAVAVLGLATTDQVLADLAHRGHPEDRQAVLDLLRLLQADHYLRRDAAGWSFSYQLIRDTWLDQRDLRRFVDTDPRSHGTNDPPETGPDGEDPRVGPDVDGSE